MLAWTLVCFILFQAMSSINVCFRLQWNDDEMSQVFVGETETGRSWRRGKEEPTLGALRSAVQALAPPEAA